MADFERQFVSKPTAPGPVFSVLGTIKVAGLNIAKRGNQSGVMIYDATAVSDFRAILASIFFDKLGATPGWLHGQVDRHNAQPWFSSITEMHLSKSTYQRSTPRTSCFSLEMAPGGQSV